MLIFKILGKILLIPVLAIIAVLTAVVSVTVSIVGIAKSVSGIVLTLMLIGTIICYQDFVQVAFLIVLILAGYLVLFAGVSIEVILETVRNKIKNLIIA